MINNIRKYNGEYKLLRNVSNPVIILGLPLTLALIYGAGLFFPVILAMVLKAFNASLLLNILLPIIIGLVTVIGVRMFYKKYGINGFFLQKRDASLHSEIKGDMSIQDILKGKIGFLK